MFFTGGHETAAEINRNLEFDLRMKKLNLLLGVAGLLFAGQGNVAAESADTNTPAWLTRPLSLADSLPGNSERQENPDFLIAGNAEQLRDLFCAPFGAKGAIEPHRRISHGGDRQ